MITQDKLKQLLNYNPDTGVFSREGFICFGYKKITLEGKKYMAHRLAWLYVYGEWPEYIDHINQVKTDNRISNLRSVSHQENMKNKPRYKNNKTGVAGVIMSYKNTNRWRALITVNKKRIHLGYYFNLFDAVCARKSAEIKYGFSKNHGAAQ